MSTRRKTLLLLACGIFALAVLWQLLRDREPSYQGRTLSQWVDQTRGSAVASEIEEARGAIRAIGTNAIPTLLQWISYEPPPLRNQIARVVGRLSPNLHARFLAYTERRADRATDVFYLLGPELRAAIPQLTQLARTASGLDRGGRCTIALACLGSEALPNVLTLVTNSTPTARTWVLFRLVNFHDAEVGVPTLIQLLDGTDPSDAELAMKILTGFDPSVVFPALTNALHAPAAQLRARAVQCLLQVRTPATQIVPALLPMLTDPDFNVRETTTNALLKIAPEVLTNAPAQ